MNGTFTGVVDRIVDGETAVILLEEGGEAVDQLDVRVDRLPEPARDEGGVLSVTVSDGKFVDAEYRPEETSNRRESARERLERLSDRLSER
ncbi:DUF3006 domain-containing protein [Natronobacterium texcoconense]|uniref:DUF3006 domain-containing protein n=1 Tax=Natronobacterium texcoconense TaxID=1095778 RepID=A0A1H1FWF0_NATTX|nr:DUF3006 domain-containing protein [Natronobacterium texcoconense]SDR05008.1 Protein of unknown function [Natronobacterium texcoconense]